MFCANCGANVPDGTVVCPNCGKPAGSAVQSGSGIPVSPGPGPAPGQNQYYQQPQQNYGAPKVNLYDHTADMDSQDISDNKVVAMLPYLDPTSIVGVIISALLCKDSKFASFHVRQALKVTVCNILIDICVAVVYLILILPISLLIAAANPWGGLGAGVASTGIILILVSILTIAFYVIRIIGFINVCKGKAVELPLLRGLKFLK